MKTFKVFFCVFGFALGTVGAIASNSLTEATFYGKDNTNQCVPGTIDQPGCSTGSADQCTVTIMDESVTAYRNSTCTILAKRN